jgi:3-phenylpropionate/trans-cinnamate dioxygenase ferredoxin subunit
VYNWHNAGINADALPEEALTEITLADKRIGLLKRAGEVYAFAATCPHTSAPLCEGWIDARGNIVCPLHKYRFDPANGRNTSGEGYKLKTYPVEIREDFIYIGII